MRFVRVTRTATVTLMISAGSYQHDRHAPTRQMTDDEIRSFEMERSGEDHAEAIIEMMSVADEKDMNHSVKVEFLDLTQGEADELRAV